MKKYSVRMPVTATVLLDYFGTVEANSLEEAQEKVIALEMASVKELLDLGSVTLTKKLVVDQILGVHTENAQVNEIQNTKRFGFEC